MSLSKILPNHFRFVHLFLFCVSIFLFSANTNAQVPTESDPPFISCTPTNERLAVRVTASLFTENGQEQFVWAIRNLPTTNDIAISNAALHGRFISVINNMTLSNGNFKVDGGRFDLILLRDVDPDDIFSLDIQTPQGIDSNPPSANDVQNQVTKTIVLCVTYTAPPTSQNAFELLIGTAKDETDPNQNSVQLTLSDIAPELQNRPAGASPVRLTFYRRDIEDAKGDTTIQTDTAARERVIKELKAVAVKAFDATKSIVIENGNITSQPIQSVLNSIDANLQKSLTVYNLINKYGEIKWGDVKAKAFSGNPANPVLTIQVEGLRLVKNVTIKVLEEEWEVNLPTRTADKLRNKRQDVQNKLLTDISGQLKVKAGRIATTEQIKEDIGEDSLSPLQKEVEQTFKPTSAPPDMASNLVYPVYRKKGREIEAVFKVQGGYTKETKFTGLLGTDFYNLLGLNEKIVFSAEGGNQVQKYRFSFNKPFDKEYLKPRFELKDLSVNIQVFKDKDQRLSNLTAEEIALRETGSNARIAFGYDSFAVQDLMNRDCLSDEKRKRNRYGVLMDASVSYQDVNIKEDNTLLTITGINPALLPQARTQTTKFSFSATAFYSHDFRKLTKQSGVGNFSLSFKTALDKGTRAFGADYNYTKSVNTFQTELQFGWQTFADMFIGYRQGFNFSSRNTPIFELNRLGGTESVRGIEEGERIGRNLYFGQIDVGLNSYTLLQMIRGKKNQNSLFCPDDNTNAEPQPADYLSKIYIKVFYDFGRIKDSTSYTTNPNFKHTVKGYGVAVELRRLARDQNGNNINISIGYARSPESRLHRSGVQFVGISYEF